MSTKEIVELLEDNLYEPNTDEKVSIFNFLEAVRRVKCNGEYEYYKNDEFTGTDPTGDGPLYVTCYWQIYFDKEKKAVVDFNNDWDFWHDYVYDHYDMNTNEIYTGNGIPSENPEVVKYYKCCMNDVPYFRPLKLENNVSIDANLDLFIGDKFICALGLFENLAFSNTEYSQRIYNLLNASTISLDILPKLYKKYMIDNTIVERRKNQI